MVKDIKRKGITRKGITQMDITQKGITQIGITRKGITQIGITRNNQYSEMIMLDRAKHSSTRNVLAQYLRILIELSRQEENGFENDYVSFRLEQLIDVLLRAESICPQSAQLVSILYLRYAFLRYPICFMPYRVMPICVMAFRVMPICVIPFRVMPICVMPFRVMPFCVMPFRVMPFCVMPFRVMPFRFMPFTTQYAFLHFD